MASNADNFWCSQGIKIAPSGKVNWSLLNMLARYFSIIRNSVLSVFPKKVHYLPPKYTSRNIIGRNPSMVIPLLANKDLTRMLVDADQRWQLLNSGKALSFESWIFFTTDVATTVYAFCKNWKLWENEEIYAQCGQQAWLCTGNLFDDLQSKPST